MMSFVHLSISYLSYVVALHLFFLRDIRYLAQRRGKYVTEPIRCYSINMFIESRFTFCVKILIIKRFV
jgi:hypothetical protein